MSIIGKRANLAFLEDKMSCCITRCQECWEAEEELISERKYQCRWCSRKVSLRCNDEVMVNSINSAIVIIGSLFFFIWGASRAPVICSIVGFCLISMGGGIVVQTIRTFGAIEQDEPELLTIESPLVNDQK